MSILRSTQWANKALNSTTAIYHLVKATAVHGEEKVINEMARRERDLTGVSYGEAVTQAAVRHREIMALSDKGAEYKALSEDLSNNESTVVNLLPA